MATTWNPADVNAQIVLSNGNLTAAASSTSGSHYPGRANVNFTSASLYWEVLINTLNVGLGIDAPGIMNIGESLATGSYLGRDANSFGYYPDNGAWGVSNSFNTIQTASAGTYIGIAITYPKVWITTNGTTFNNGLIAAQNPVGSIGGLDISAITGALYPAIDVSNSTSQGSFTGNFGATTFNYSTLFTALKAAGYSSFDTSGGTAYTLTAAEGTYSLTGEAVTFTAVRSLTAAQGSYALTGEAATLTYTQAGSAPAVQVRQPATQSAGAGHGPLRDRSRDKRRPDEYYQIYQDKVNKRHAKRVNARSKQKAIEEDDDDFEYLLLVA